MKTFVEKVVQNCRLQAERDAICEGNRRISYGELLIFSSRVYAWLHRRHIGPGDVVMIRVGNTIDAVVACIGVLRAGAAFVIAGRNQDPKTVRYMERDCGCRIRIDDESMPEAMAVKGQSGFETLDEHAPAYIIYTSGSTRAPRGVMIERGAMTLCEASIAWQGKPIVHENDRVALLSPLTFTAGLILMNVTLSVCATIVAVPDDTLGRPAALKRCFLDNRVTHCFMTPTLYRAFHDFNPGMRTVVLGGEPILEAEPALRRLRSCTCFSTCITSSPTVTASGFWPKTSTAVWPGSQSRRSIWPSPSTSPAKPKRTSIHRTTGNTRMR